MEKNILNRVENLWPCKAFQQKPRHKFFSCDYYCTQS